MGLKARPGAAALHRRAKRYNWDDGTDGLERIVADPACDFGTALLIFWLGAPGFDRQYAGESDVEGWRLETFRFLRRLEKRLLNGDFHSAAILFNPRFDCTTISQSGHDWTAEYDDVKVRRPIPAALREPSCADPAWEARERCPAANTANRLT